MKNSPPGSSWTSAQWLCLLVAAAVAGAGWVQAAKWKRQVTELQSVPQGSGTSAPADAITTSAGLALPSSSGSPAESPTLALMEDVDLMRQIDLLSAENQRLNEELQRVRKDSTDRDKAERERAAIDGTAGGGILR